MPELLHGFPVLDLTASYYILEIVGLLMHECLVANVVVELGVLELLALAGALSGTLIIRVCNDSRDEIAGLHVASVTHLCVSCAIIDHDSRKFAHF